MPISVEADKRRIIQHLEANFANLPDDDDEMAELAPHIKATATQVLAALFQEDFRPAEWAALLSLLGPIKARSPRPSRNLRHRRLRAI